MNADTETKVEEARSRAEKLIDDGAQVLVGTFDSGATAAMAQVAEQRKIPFVINIAAAPQITEQGYKYVFRNFPTASTGANGLALIRDLIQATGAAPRRAVFMHVNDTFGTAMASGIGGDPAAARLTAIQDRGDDLLRPGGARPLGRGGQGQGDQRRYRDAGLPAQRRHPAGARDGQAALPAEGVVSPGSPGMYESSSTSRWASIPNTSSPIVPWYNPKAEMTHGVEAAFNKQFPEEKLVFHALNVGFTFEAM